MSDPKGSILHRLYACIRYAHIKLWVKILVNTQGSITGVKNFLPALAIWSWSAKFGHAKFRIAKIPKYKVILEQQKVRCVCACQILSFTHVHCYTIHSRCAETTTMQMCSSCWTHREGIHQWLLPLKFFTDNLTPFKIIPLITTPSGYFILNLQA